MANKTLFKSLAGKLIPAADARNEHNAPAYALTPKQALAQYAATGCLGATFYAGAEEQLAKVLELCGKVEPEFVAKTAVYAREQLPADCRITGPAIIEQMDTTTVVPPKARLRQDRYGYLHIELEATTTKRSPAWAAAV